MGQSTKNLARAVQDLLVLSIPPHYNDEQAARRLHVHPVTLNALRRALHEVLNEEADDERKALSQTRSSGE